MTNPLTPLAKMLRKNQTEAEKLLWRGLRSKGLSGLKFRRQQPIGNYIVDFVCLDEMLIIEVDGGQHADDEGDLKRDSWLQKEGFRVLRFWNNDVLGNLDGVTEVILQYCGSPSPQSPPARLSSSQALKGGEEKRKLFLFPILFTLMVLLPSSVLAHVEQGQATGFITGLRHPWSGLDHVLAMIAVGLWGAQLGPPAIWLLPVTFPMVMSLGAMMGLLGIPLPGIEIGIALSAILLGTMVFGELRPKLAIAVMLVGFFAIFHGHAHGTELPPGQSGLLYSMGFVMATGILHGLGITIGLVHRWPTGQLALRGAGAFIALMGVTFLWRALS